MHLQKPERIISLRTAVFAFIFAFAQTAVNAENITDYSRWNDLDYTIADDRSMAFTEMQYDHAMSDSVYAMAVFEDGRVFMFSLFHYDALLFDSWGVYMLLAEPDGATHWKTERLRKKTLAVSHETLSVSTGDNTVTGGGRYYRIRWHIENMAVDLTYRNILDPWMPDDGTDVLSEDGTVFQTRSVFTPWAEVTGTITIEDRTFRVSGEGMAEKTIIVNRLSRFNPELLSMRVFGVTREVLNRTPGPANFHIGLLDSTAHPSYGSQRIPRLFTVGDSTWLFATGDYEIDITQTRLSENGPYEYPTVFSLEAHAQGYTLSGEYRVERLFNITDIIDEVPGWLRPLILIFINRPVYFRCLGFFDGTLTSPDGTTEPFLLYGPYEYVIVR